MYEFTNNWFGVAQSIWDQMLPQVNPSRVLEIGSYEGRSACYLIEKIGPERPLELHCVDTWEGGVDNAGTDMAAVEKRFLANVEFAKSKSEHPVDLKIQKKPSDQYLSELLASGGRGYFDIIYVDGSHQAPDVLLDAVMSFRLLRTGGVMIFDDYLWSEKLPGGVDPLRCPKPAIDAFVNLYARKLQVVSAPLYQLYVTKTAE